MKKERVFVGMSGGVDSSVAAYLLKQATPNNYKKLFGRPTPKGFRGYDVIGVFMRGYNIDNCQDKDAEDARRVAEHLGIPFYTWDFEKEYKNKVVDYMIAGYKKGITPNPDVMCNREIKFGIFFERAMRLGADFVATGHYVKRELCTMKHEKNEAKGSGPRFTLHIARDVNKDQSYFLWTLTPRQIEKSLFPVGAYLKPEVRRIGKYAGLSTAQKKDSQGICFLGMVSIKDFLEEYLPEKKGAVLNLKGEKIGEHQGAHFYTIGQRGGVGNMKHEKGQNNHQPLYVAKKDIKKNILVVAEGKDNPALCVKSVYLADTNFIYNLKPTRLAKANAKREIYNLSVLARVRYRQPLFGAVLTKEKNRWRLDFKNPQKFVAPGQSAVFYSKTGEMLGGGVII